MRPNRNVVRKLFKLSFGVLRESLGIKVAKNLKYLLEDIVKSLIYISLKSTSAESDSKDLAKDMDVSSLDVMLRRLKSLDLRSVINLLNKINAKIVKKHIRD